uniref:Uncharacterized protein n=1 Tax=Desertifilum tharense IPPAS B-1220 TaxID=1781255 RepID=A0ACD5GPC0_9CYAN
MGEEGEFSNDSILYSVPHSEHWHQVRYRTRNERTLFPPPSSPLGTRNSELCTPFLTRNTAAWCASYGTQHLALLSSLGTRNSELGTYLALCYILALNPPFDRRFPIGLFDNLTIIKPFFSAGLRAAKARI